MKYLNWEVTNQTNQFAKVTKDGKWYLFCFKAQDAKERQHWVNILRLVSQSFATETNINTNVNHTMQNNASSSHIITSNGENSHSSSSLSIVIPSSNESFDFKNCDYKLVTICFCHFLFIFQLVSRKLLFLFRISNFELVKEIFHHVKLGNQKLESLIAVSITQLSIVFVLKEIFLRLIQILKI